MTFEIKIDSTEDQRHLRKKFPQFVTNESSIFMIFRHHLLDIFYALHTSCQVYRPTNYFLNKQVGVI